MNTMNNYYFHRIQRKRNIYSKTLNIIHKILIVISVYLVFGLLFQYAHANTDASNNKRSPCQTQHGSVQMLHDKHDAHFNPLDK